MSLSIGADKTKIAQTGGLTSNKHGILTVLGEGRPSKIKAPVGLGSNEGFLAHG